MNNEICVGYLTNIRDMFAVGSERCEDEALKYYQNFISALNYAIELINAPTVSDRYDEGYAQGYIDGSTGADWKGDTK